jgi:hypothetical protein
MTSNMNAPQLVDALHSELFYSNHIPQYVPLMFYGCLLPTHGHAATNMQ